MIRNLLIGLVGGAFLMLGVLGLLLPILPGFLFLFIALMCFATISPTVRRRLEGNRTLKALHGRWRRGRGLPLWHRMKLMFWLSAESTVQTFNARRDS